MVNIRTSTTSKPKLDDNYVLVMTACIDPGGQHPELNRRDPNVRRQDYEEALRFWITHPDPRLKKIVFIENTGYPLQTLQDAAVAADIYHKKVEFISLQCNGCPPGLSYGYPELTMLDIGLPQSRLFQDSKYIIKTTGRLVFPDLPRLLNRLPDSYMFAVDSRDNKLRGRPFITTQLMIFASEFYRSRLFGIRDQMTPQFEFIEHLFYQKLMTFKGQPGAILRWPVNVDPVGRAGHNGKDYSSPQKRALSVARAASRVLLPRWWI